MEDFSRAAHAGQIFPVSADVFQLRVFRLLRAANAPSGIRNAPDAGVGTKAGAVAGTTVLMIDWSGSADSGASDVTGQQVVAAVVYNASGAYSFADTCVQSVEPGIAIPASGGSTFMVGSRNNEMGRYFNGTLGELLVYGRPLNDSERNAVEAYLATKWPRPGPPLACLAINCTLPASLAQADARLTAFVAGMRVAGFADSRYEAAHALTALDSAAAWSSRCAGLLNGTIEPLASPVSEAAADALFVATASNLASGLATVLDGYANATDPQQRAIYAVWQASAPLSLPLSSDADADAVAIDDAASAVAPQ